MNKEQLIEYATLKKEIKEREARLDELQPSVLAAIQELQRDEVELNGYGTFVLAKRRAWTYTEATQALVKQTKDAQKREEQTGDAQYEEKPYIIYKQDKEE